MCLFLVLALLIPVLSGYAVYLAVVTVVTEGSAVVQVTVSSLGLVLLLGLAVYGFKVYGDRRRSG